jgi:hypothetical protein
MWAWHYQLRDRVARLRTKYLLDIVFVHINKTGGSSVEAALKLPFQHRTARELRAVIGQARWERRFSFAFIRNPWDKVVSHYFYRVKTNQTGLGDGRVGFGDWVRAAYGERDPRFYDQPKMFMAQFDWLIDENGEIMVDFVGRFEQLNRDFATVCTRTGRRAQLPHLKPSGARDYRTLYDGDTFEIVRRCFAADIDAFGYAFDAPSVASRS